jgi:dGTPase
MRSAHTRGRRYPEEPHAFRTSYQRDRDRIVHCTAFRRLMHKTQVLVTQTNDHHRTRLTHTLEVAQISRTIGRRLGLNEDLVEAIALSHDLGHPPFGHAGERALDRCMANQGGFEHNLHGLRIVDELEYPYAEFPGLNLTFEVREAMAQHSPKHDSASAMEFLALGRPLLEAQVVDAADSLAYDAHDIDDALSVGLIAPDDLSDVRFWRKAVELVYNRHGELGPEKFQTNVVRTLINLQVADLLEQAERAIRRERIESLEDVRAFPGLLVVPSEEVRDLKAELEHFLHERVYAHHRVLRMAGKGAQILVDLFNRFTQEPRLLPPRYARRIGHPPEAPVGERVVCDYVAGMTDRYAQQEHLRLFHPYSIV